MTHSQDPSGLPPAIAHQLRHYASAPARQVKGMCWHVCSEMRSRISTLTIVVGAAQATGRTVVHCWLEHDGRIIDPTRQQFGSGPVTLWRAKRQDLSTLGFYRQVGDYFERNPEVPQQEVLESLCDPAYRDEGLFNAPQESASTMETP